MPACAHEGFGPAQPLPRGAFLESEEEGWPFARHGSAGCGSVRRSEPRRRSPSSRSRALSYLAISKQVTLVVDGRPEAIRTMSANVGELLVGEGIDLAAGLSVQPPPATRLADGMTVRVDSLAELRAVAGRTSGVGVWVVEGSSRPVAKIAGQLVEGSPSASGAGIASVVAVRAVVMGKVHDVLTNAATAGELLSAMGITPDADDRVRPSPSTPLHVGSRIRFDQVRVFTKNVDAPIPFTTGTTTSTRAAIRARSASCSPASTGCCGPRTA